MSNIRCRIFDTPISYIKYVSYVPYDIAQAMASRVINEIRTRIDPLDADTRLMKIQKLVDGLKQKALQVVNLITRT